MGNTKHTKEQIRERIQQKKLLFDGAFGTYYGGKYDTKQLPELANLEASERVKEIHREYLEAGAQILRTNTFAANSFCMDLSKEQIEETLRSGVRLAKAAVEEWRADTGETGEVYIAADIGQIPCDAPAQKDLLSREYEEICRIFLEEGVDFFVFETFSEMEEILPAIKMIGEQAFITVQFSVNQFGYSNAGLSARKLLQRAGTIKEIDAVGFNCGVGPSHMYRILQTLYKPADKFLTALPNAGYPQMVTGRMIFTGDNREYFVDRMQQMIALGVDMAGGCCGTTPEYIADLAGKLDFTQYPQAKTNAEPEKKQAGTEDHSFYHKKEAEGGKKLIAVELAPPMGIDDEKLMDAAHLLQRSGVDVLTFPDSPSGRTRADSILMAEKVARETGMCVMPHICCRDKNAIAMRSQLLGAYINGIHNFLVITGDPIPSLVRTTVKSVFNFDSVGLMQILADMNEEQFAQAPVSYGGAINQGRRNLEVEIGRVKKKMAAGATFFLTQPISTKESADRVRRIKEETGARILCGIMPFVSLKNATFMKNEMAGIDVTDEVLERYRADMTREEGEQAGVQLAKEVIAMTEDFADGYYFSFPFNRVTMLEKILD